MQSRNNEAINCGDDTECGSDIINNGTICCTQEYGCAYGLGTTTLGIKGLTTSSVINRTSIRCDRYLGCYQGLLTSQNGGDLVVLYHIINH